MENIGTEEDRKRYQDYLDNPDKQSFTGYTVQYKGQTYNYTNQQIDDIKRAYSRMNQDAEYSQKAYASYKDNDFDRFAMQNGLPSWNQWNAVEKYAKTYNASGSFDDNYGSVSDDQWKKINELWAKDWQYGLSDADAVRKAAGLAPVSYDEMYEATRLDDELKAKGLPPSKLLKGKLGESYNAWADNNRKYNEFMAEVSREWAKRDAMNADRDESQRLVNETYAAMGRTDAPTVRAHTFEEALDAVLARPEYTEFADKHFARNLTEPKRYDEKYQLKDQFGDPERDANGQILYDDEKFEKDFDSWLQKKAKVDGDEFAITLETAQKFYDEHYPEIKAYDDALAAIKMTGIDPLTASDAQTERLYDVYAGMQAETVTAAQMFPDATPEQQTALQPIVQRFNDIMHTAGVTAAQNYLQSDEYKKSLHTIEEQDIVASFRQQYPESPKTDDQIKDDYYKGIATSYGMNDEQLEQFRNGTLTISDYMSGIVQTDADAWTFAREKHVRELEALGLPTTLEGLKDLEKELFDKSRIAEAARAEDAYRGFKTEETEESKQLETVRRAIHNWEGAETANYAAAVPYLSNFAQDTANADEAFADLVNSSFYDRAMNWESEELEQTKESKNRIEMLTQNASDEEKAIAVYLNKNNSWSEVIHKQDGSTEQKQHNEIAENYIKQLAAKYSNQQVQDRKQFWTDYYNSQSGIMKVGLAHLAMNAQFFGAPIEGAYNFVKQTFDTFTGRDTYASDMASLSTDMFGSVAGEIEKQTGKVVGTAYQMAPSFMQSLAGSVAAAFTGGATEALTLAAMSLQSYSSTSQEALLNGATTEQAWALGVASGVAEALFEKVSLDHFVSNINYAAVAYEAAKESGASSAKVFFQTALGMLKRSAIQGGIEASEEGFTSIANLLSEQLILGFDSDYEKRKQHFIEAGYSAEDARKLAATEIVDSVKRDMVLGFASGALMTFGTDLVMVGGNIRVDQTGATRFLNRTHNLSAISVDEAVEIANSSAARDADGNITVAGARNAVRELLRKGADASVLSAVRNEITTEETPTNVQDVFARAILRTNIRDANYVAKAALQVAARAGASSESFKNSIDKAVRSYLSNVSETLQLADQSKLDQAVNRVKEGFIDRIFVQTGRALGAGMDVVADYMKTIPTDELKAGAEPIMVQLKQSGMTNMDNAAKYANNIYALTRAARDERFATAFSATFGSGATDIASAIQTACLNSSDAEHVGFMDVAFEAIGVYQRMSDDSLTRTLGAGMDGAAYVASLMALAEGRKSGSNSRTMYDYIRRNGATRSALDALAAVDYYDNMNASARAAADKYVREHDDAFMTSDDRQLVSDDMSAAKENLDSKRALVESHEQHNAQTLATADSIVQRHQAASDAVRETETVVDANGNVFRTTAADLAEVAASYSAALSDAINARDNLAQANADRLESAKADLRQAEQKFNKVQKKYKTAMNRHSAAYVNMIGSQLEVMRRGDVVASSEFDRITALAMSGTREDLNSIQAKIIASEKLQAVCLGNEIGADVEIVKFTDEFFKSIGEENGRMDAKALVKDGKVYMNESVWENRVGYGTDNVLWHEFSHVAQISPKNWSAYADLAYDYMCAKYGKETIDRFDQVYGRTELAAEFARKELMTDPRAVRALCSKAPVMATRIYQWLSRISAKHNNTIAQMKTIADAQMMFARSLKAAAKVNGNVDSAAVVRTNEAFEARNELEEVNANTETATDTRTETDTQDRTSETEQNTETEQSNETENTDTRASEEFDNIEQKEYNIDGKTESEAQTAPRVELPFELPENVQNLINSFVKGKADHSVNGLVNPNDNKAIRNLIKNQVNKAAAAAGVTVDADTLNAYAEQYTLPEFQTSGESWINSYKPTRNETDFGDEINSTAQSDAQYYTEIQPTYEQLHDLAWYRTDGAKEYWANNPAYKDWVHKDLAWISGAAHNQVTIPFEELMSVEKIANAQQYVEDNATPSLDDYGFVHGDDTKVISDLKGGDPGRKRLMKQLVRRLFDAQNGSAEMEIRKGKLKMKKINDVPQYTGEVDRDKKAYIILGRPASGKSAVFADPLSFHNKARIIDSDLVKSWLPEFAEGLGAGKLQLESAVIAETALEAALEKGENVVIPRVGGKNGTPKLIQQLKKAGYEINLYYNDLPQGKSIMRAMSRFAETGRYLSINYLHNDLIADRFKNKAFVGFETSLKNMRDDINYIEWRDNDVELNQDPVEIWNSESGEDFDKAKERVQAGSARGDGRRTSGGVQTAGELTSGGASSGESGAVQVNYYTEIDPAQAAAIDSEYMPLAEKYVAGDASVDEIARLRTMVADQAMRSAKRFNTNPYLNDEGNAPRQLYSGQKLGIDEFKPKYGPIYTTDNIGVADTYLKDSVNEDDKVEPFVVQRKDMYVLGNDDNVNLIDNARRLLNENYEDVSTHTEDEQREVMMRWKDTLMNLNEEIEADNPPSFSEIDQELSQKLQKYGDRNREILADIRSLIECIEYLPLQIRNHIESIFGFGYDQTSSYDSSTVENYVRMYDSLNKKLTELFSSDPETFSSGKMKYYYDFVMNGGLDAIANDILQQMLGDVAEYGMTNVFANQETGEIRTKGELQSRLSQRSNKGVYGVYGFEGSSPYKMNGRHSEWLDLVSADYDGSTTDAIAGNAFRDARSSVEIDDIDDILDSGLMNENYSTYGNDYIFPVGTRLIKSSDLVTLDSDRNIIPLSQRFDLTKRSIDYYTQFDELEKAINAMSDTERTRLGDPRLVQGRNGLLVARNVTAEGFISGNLTTDGNRNIAMLFGADKFTDGQNTFVHRGVGLSDATAAVIPNGLEYGRLRSEARENGVNVVTYDESEPSQFDNAVNLAAASGGSQYFSDFDQWLKEYGAIDQGMTPRVENRAVPRQTNRNNRVSKMVSTIAESPATSDEQYENDIKRFVENGGGTYMPTTNARTLAKARTDIDRLGGAQNALSKLTADVAAGSGKITDQLAMAESLYLDDEAMRSFSDDQREQLLCNLTILAHDAGTALQLTQAIKRMSPQGHEFYMEQVGKRMADRYEKRTGKPTNLTLTDEERQAYRDAKTQQEFDDIDQRVMNRWDNETSDLPLRERIRNWRYLSMLGNFRTHIRNIVGNLLMYPIVRTKDSINALYQLGLDPSERTTTGVTKPLDEQTRAYVQGALEEAMPTMQGVSSKYIDAVSKAKPGDMSDGKLRDLFKKLLADNPTTHVSNGRTLLGRALNKISSFNSNALELEDAFSLGMRFRSSFAQQIQAKQLDVTKITPAQRSQMINYAMEEALRATFRDANTIADALNNFQRSHKVLGFITESIVPFKKTPMNIVRRSIEYSPIGLVQGAYKAISNNAMYRRNVAAINAMNISDSAKQARLRSAERAYKADRIAAIDRLASGTTGGILTALGVVAAYLGWISIGRKDDDSTAFETALGRNAYSLNIGDVSVDLSAFSPAAIPLLMGTALYESLHREGNDSESVIGDVINTLVESLDPITEMSMLSGIADALAGISYSGQEEGRNTRYIGQIALNTAKSYVGQYIPTVVGQIARVTDPYARSYSAGGEYFASKIAGPEVGSAVKTLQNKIPFVSWLSEPKVNLHGDQVRNYTNFGEWVLHTANNMLLPATIKVDQKNAIDDELVRLYGVTDGSNLFPTKPSRNLGSVTDKKTNKPTPIKLQNDAEYRQYQEEYGQLMYDALEDLMQSSAYRRMTDDQKASAVEDIVSNTKTQIRKLWKARKAKDLK